MTEMMQLRTELNSIGNNFNQVVKKLHTLGQIAEFRNWIITYELEKKILLKLNYNEQKVKEQLATCLAAENYPKDLEHLNFYQKLNRLQNQAALNVRTKVNSVHISLNFDPQEKLSEERLKEIADGYLQKIGFTKQPYLLYQHHG
jgi:hypothetical protein